jgi:hypothetical protein
LAAPEGAEERAAPMPFTGPLVEKRRLPGRQWALVLASSLVLAAGCMNTPRSTNLRFAPADAHPGWAAAPGGRLRTHCGPATVTVNLFERSVLIGVMVENPAAGAVELRLGSEGGAAGTAVGDLWRQPLAQPQKAAESVPYLAHEPVALRGGWRAEFLLNNLLGKELQLGQYLVLTLAVQGPGSGDVQRCALPLSAVSSMPASAR